MSMVAHFKSMKPVSRDRGLAVAEIAVVDFLAAAEKAGEDAAITREKASQSVL